MFLELLKHASFLVRRPAPAAARRRLTLSVETLEAKNLLAPTVLLQDHPFTVWTQNTQLRPNNLFSVAEHAELIGIGTVLGGPLGTGVAVGAALTAEGVYDTQVQNTTDDNTERGGILLNRLERTDVRYDVVALQEVFDSDAVDQVSHGAVNRGFYWLPGPDESGFEQNSGLGLLVRRGLSASPSEGFDLNHRGDQVFQEEGPITGSDAWAQKGFTLTTVHLGDDPRAYFYVVNTHLLSDYPPTDHFPGQRAAQIDQMRRYVDAHTDPSHPVLFLGDFNFDSRSPEYNAALRALNAQDLVAAQLGPNAFTSDKRVNAYDRNWNEEEWWNRNPTDANPDPLPPAGYTPQRLDYILVRQGNDFRITSEWARIENRTQETALSRAEGWRPEHVYLSDHFGVSARLHLVRSMDFGTAAQNAVPMTLMSGRYDAAGTLHTSSGTEFYSFYAGGRINVRVRAEPRSIATRLTGELGVQLELYDRYGNRVGTGSQTLSAGGRVGDLATTLDVNVPEGQYYLAVRSRAEQINPGRYIVEARDLTGPKFVSVRHERQNDTVSEPVRLYVHFDEPIAPLRAADVVLRNGLGQRITLTDANITPVPPLTTSPGSANRSFEIRLATAPRSGYRLEVLRTVRDRFNNRLDQNGTGPDRDRFIDQAAPAFVGAVTTTRNIRVTFAEAVDPRSFTAAAIEQLTDGDGQRLTLAGPVRVVFGSGNTSFDLPLTRAPSHGYTLRLRSRITDLWGNPFDTTRQPQQVSDRTGPTVVGIEYLGQEDPWIVGTAAAASTRSLRVRFSEAVDSTTFTPDDVTITDPSGRPVTVLSVQAENAGSPEVSYRVTFRPNSSLATGTYTVRIGTAYADVYANAAAGGAFQRTFEVGPPIVIRPSPGGARIDERLQRPDPLEPRQPVPLDPIDPVGRVRPALELEREIIDPALRTALTDPRLGGSDRRLP